MRCQYSITMNAFATQSQQCFHNINKCVSLMSFNCISSTKEKKRKQNQNQMKRKANQKEKN